MAEVLESRKRESSEKDQAVDETTKINDLLKQQHEEIICWREKYEKLEQELLDLKRKSVDAELQEEKIQDLERKIEIVIQENEKLNLIMEERAQQTVILEKKMKIIDSDPLTPEIESTIQIFKQSLDSIKVENDLLIKRVKYAQNQGKLLSNINSFDLLLYFL